MLQTINANTNTQGHTPEAMPEFLYCSVFFETKNDSAVQKKATSSQLQEKIFSTDVLGDRKIAVLTNNRALNTKLGFYNETNDSAVLTITQESKDYCQRSF